MTEYSKPHDYTSPIKVSIVRPINMSTNLANRLAEKRAFRQYQLHSIIITQIKLSAKTSNTYRKTSAMQS